MNTADLIETHRRMVYAIAHEQHAKLGGEFDELVGDGMVALVTEAARFDATVGTSFRQFAHKRIAGAMIDGYRRRNRTGKNHSSGPRVELLDLNGFTSPPAHYLTPLKPDMRVKAGGRYVGDMLPSVPDVADQAIDRFALAVILERLAELPPSLREVVDVVIAGGRLSALAERDGVSGTAITHRLGTARRWLRDGKPTSGRYAVAARRRAAA